MPILSRPDYLAPSFTDTEDTKLGWLKEANEQAETYLKSQRNWRDIDKAVDIISGAGMDKVTKTQSKVHVNMLKRDIREAVATLANMRPLWGYKTDNQKFQELANILNKMLMSWYLSTFADRGVRKGLQFAAGLGKGYLSPYWKKDFWVAGRGDIGLKWYGPRDVLPVQIGRDHDLQGAYVVTIRDEVPIAKAMAMHPTQIDKLAPDRSAPTWMRKGIRRVQKFLSPVLQRFGPGQGKDTEETIFPTVDIYRSYILDLSINESGNDLLMGTGTKWAYKVPSYGALLETGEKDTSGNPTFRKATLEDSLIFPLRRMVLWTNQGILYDDTAQDWHGKVPLVSFEVDDWPWDFIGCSMTKDGESIQESNTEILRLAIDSAKARLDPALGYDESLLSKALMDRLNTRAAGQRVAMNLQMGDAVKPILSSQYYDVPEWIVNLVEKQYERLHYLLGTRDIQAIAKARQVPAGDSLEKLMELAGPLVTDMSRNMERSMRDLGEMWKALAMQHYDVGRRVQILGKDGVTEEDFDYDPGNMIPSHLPDELELIKQQRMREDAPSRASMVERARAHINSCYFHVTPNSLHQITQLTRKLMYLQLWRSGFPIDPWTVADALDISNYGELPETAKGHTVFANWIAWMKMKAELGEALGGGQRGRKPSGQQAPTIQPKDGGSRSTIRESAR